MLMSLHWVNKDVLLYHQVPGRSWGYRWGRPGFLGASWGVCTGAGGVDLDGERSFVCLRGGGSSSSGVSGVSAGRSRRRHGGWGGY